MPAKARIAPQLLGNQRLYGFVPSSCPAYAPRLKRILEPFGVKAVLQNQSADSLRQSLRSNQGGL